MAGFIQNNLTPNQAAYLQNRVANQRQVFQAQVAQPGPLTPQMINRDTLAIRGDIRLTGQFIQNNRQLPPLQPMPYPPYRPQ